VHAGLLQLFQQAIDILHAQVADVVLFIAAK